MFQPGSPDLIAEVNDDRPGSLGAKVVRSLLGRHDLILA
jgi:hypothetical protein